MPDKDGGPFLAIALLCDNVIEGKDGVLSIIRVVDRVNAIVPSDAQEPFRVPVVVTLVTSFKAGTAKGDYTLKIEIETPVGKIVAMGETSFTFQDGIPEQGANIVARLNLVVEAEGVYWFNLYLQDAFITRIPFRLAYHRSEESAKKLSDTIESVMASQPQLQEKPQQ